MKIHFLITTYNRGKGLWKLLDSIDKYVSDKKATVVDDASDYDVEGIVDKFNFVELKQNKRNLGKKYFWKTISRLYKSVKDSDADYFVSVQDDKFLLPNTIGEAVYYWDNIQDNDKIAMNIFTHMNRFGKSARDVGIQPKPILFDNVLVLKNMWCDHHFICERKFFKELNYQTPEIPLSRWEKRPNRPSGVGGKTSKILVDKGYNIYTAPRTLIGIGDIENSLMNPNMNRPNYSRYGRS
jgi:hypothetical protein